MVSKRVELGARDQIAMVHFFLQSGGGKGHMGGTSSHHYNKGREPTLIERRLKADGLLRNFNYATTC
jgi:hypothetical protein